MRSPARPVRDFDGNRIPLSRWERTSRNAGVVKGDDWAQRLGRLIDTEAARMAVEQASEDPQDWRIDRSRQAIESAEACADSPPGSVRARFCRAEDVLARPHRLGHGTVPDPARRCRVTDPAALGGAVRGHCGHVDLSGFERPGRRRPRRFADRIAGGPGHGARILPAAGGTIRRRRLTSDP